jgi:hypothetical protein
MNVLVACEFSGIVREAFRKRGHNAFSCDLLPTEIPSDYHIQMDVFELLADTESYWDMMIFFWPCTNMAVSGARWFCQKRVEQERDIAAFAGLMNVRIPAIAGENPVGVLSTRFRKPSQIIHPWWFGHGETKATCLWLLGLPPLKPTKIVRGRRGRVWREPPSPDRWKNRSRMLPGIADAMAEQWSNC